MEQTGDVTKGLGWLCGSEAIPISRGLWPWCNESAPYGVSDCQQLTYSMPRYLTGCSTFHAWQLHRPRYYVKP